MPRVSVVIPAYNAASLLGATLNSVLQSSYKDFEVVVVNDGSQDDTEAVASSFGNKVHVISQENAGMSASRNRAIDYGNSEYIALLDSDDIWHPDKLKFQVEALDKHLDHSFCFTAFSQWYGESNAQFLTESRNGEIDPEFSGWIYHKLVLTNWALPSSLMFRRDAWRVIGPFHCNDQQTDDWDFIVRASQGCRYLKLAESFVLYRQHVASLSRKLPKNNTGEAMRESFFARFGMTSPDGTNVDKAELEHWRYLGWSNFADAHCARGSLRTGVATFGELLLEGPRRGQSLIKLIKSIGRRVIPKK